MNSQLFPGTLFSRLTCTLLFLTLTACGGGGGGGDGAPAGSNNGYTGITADAEIGVTNAKTIAADTLNTIDLVEVLSLFNGERSYLRYIFSTGSLADLQGDGDCESGSINADDRRNSNGVGDIVYNFANCKIDDTTLLGAINVAVSSDLQTYIKTTITPQAFTMRAMGDEIAITGQIVSNFNIYGELVDHRAWTANLLFKFGNGRQIKVDNLERIGDYYDYAIVGEIALSDVGNLTVGMSTNARKLDVAGANSTLNIVFETSGQSTNSVFVPVLAYDITLSDETGLIPAQTIGLPTNKLFFPNSYPNMPPEIIWNDLASIKTGAGFVISPTLTDHDTFYEYRWELDSFDGACDIEVLEVSNIYHGASPCFGTSIVSLVLSDGTNQFSHNYSVYTERALPEAAYPEYSETVSANDSFELTPVIENPDQGPFSYSVAYGIPGASVSESGVFSWSFDGRFPLLSNTQVVNYGVAITNDNPVYSNISVTIVSDDIPDLIYKPYGAVGDTSNNAVAWHEGAIDTNPNDPFGEIAFLRRSRAGEVIAKYNKATGQIRTINNVPRVFSSSLGWASPAGRHISFQDWNDDGIADLVYSQTVEQGGQEVTKLIVYDLVAEMSIVEEIVFRGQINNITDATLLDIQLVDYDNDGRKEFIFILQGVVDYGASNWQQRGIYAYDPDTRAYHRIGDEIITAQIKVADVDNDGAPELLEVWRQGPLSFNLYDINGLNLVLTHSYNQPSNLYSYNYREDITTLIIKNIDEDPELEIITTVDDESLGCTRGFDENGAFLMVLDSDLSLIVEKALDFTVFNGMDSNLSENDPNIMMGSKECPAPEFRGDSKIVYFNPLTATEIWKEPLKTVAHDASPTQHMSFTAFSDSLGKRQFVIGNVFGIIATQ